MPLRFHEENDDPDYDPQAVGKVGFDWDAVYKNFNEYLSDQTKDDRLAILDALNGFMMKAFDLHRKDPDRHVGRRYIAFVWVVSPQLIPGSPSGREVARCIGISSVTFAKLTSEVTRHFGITNHAQAHGWNRRKATTRTNKPAIPQTTPPLSTIKHKQSVHANVSTQT